MINLVDATFIRENGPVQSGVAAEYIKRAIIDAESLWITPIIKQDFYDELITQITPPGSLTALNQQVLDRLEPADLYYTLYELAPALNAQFTSAGLSQKDQDNGVSLERQEMYRARLDYKRKADHYMDIVIEFMCENTLLVRHNNIPSSPIFFRGHNNAK